MAWILFFDLLRTTDRFNERKMTIQMLDSLFKHSRIVIIFLQLCGCKPSLYVRKICLLA